VGVTDIFMLANARLDDAHGWKHRRRSASLSLFPGGGRLGGFGMLLGPEGTGPAPCGGGFCCLLCRVRIPVLIPVPDRGSSPGFPGGWVVGGVWWVALGFVGWWVFVNWIVDASIL